MFCFSNCTATSFLFLLRLLIKGIKERKSNGKVCVCQKEKEKAWGKVKETLYQEQWGEDCISVLTSFYFYS